MDEFESYEIRPIATVRSSLTRREDAPRQGSEGAPEAWIELLDEFRDGLLGVEPGRELILVTWLHRSERDVLQVRPHHDPQRTLKGVFVTRSPDRPNPIGLHPVTVLEVDGCRLRVTPLEAIDGTPVLDIKVATRADGRCPEPSQ